MKKSILNPLSIIRIGLGLVFLANALTAFSAPAELVEIIEKSFVANLLPVSMGLFILLIGVNDALVATLLFLNRGKRSVAIWAVLWILGVMMVRGAPLEILEESGFLFMAVALAINNQKE